MKTLTLISLLFAIGFLPGVYAQQIDKEKEKELAKKQIITIMKFQEEMKREQEKIARQSAEMNITYEKMHIPNMEFSSDNNKTLTLRKTYHNQSATKKATFDVDKYTYKLRLNIKGACKEGFIKVIIYLPSGKKFKELLIDPSADISWSQSIPVAKIDEPDKYRGKWGCEIEAVNAEGYYTLSFSSLYHPGI